MRLIIIGAGGHGRVVVDAALAADMDVFAFVDSDPTVKEIKGIPIYDSLEMAIADNDYETPHFIVAIGDNEVRAKEYSHAMAAGLKPASVIHPSSVVSDTAYIAPGSFIAAQAVVNTDASVGENAIVNTAAIIEHDCVIGAHAFISPAAVLCGRSRIGAHSFVSANATLIPNAKVGEHVLIAAGAVVTKSFPDNQRLIGIPARNIPLRKDEVSTGLIPEAEE